MAKTRRTRQLLMWLPLSVLGLGLLLLFLAIPRTGYCFDCEFGAGGERLYVTAGRKGLHVLDVSPEGALRKAATYHAGGYYRYLEIVGDMAYVANSGRGLEILDVSGETPVPVWAEHGSKAYGIHIEGNTAYLACDDLGLRIVDIADPEAPGAVGSLASIKRAWDVWVNGAYAFVADHDRGLIVVEVSDASQPREVGELSWGDDVAMAEVIDGAGHTVYIASGKHGLVVVDVSAPRVPVMAFRYDPGEDSWGEGVLVEGDALYVSMVDSISAEENGLHVFDIQEPLAPRLLRKCPVSDGVEDLTVAGQRLALANTLSGVVLFDVGVAAAPVRLDTYPAPFWRFFTSRLE